MAFKCNAYKQKKNGKGKKKTMLSVQAKKNLKIIGKIVKKNPEKIIWIFVIKFREGDSVNLCFTKC
jgi:hypothetical protein